MKAGRKFGVGEGLFIRSGGMFSRGFLSLNPDFCANRLEVTTIRVGFAGASTGKAIVSCLAKAMARSRGPFPSGLNASFFD